ncbi:actin-like 6A [Mayamaea pseudoterrestris]|nr:actin-like 6A [Mayamaea pseudoterrestris]
MGAFHQGDYIGAVVADIGAYSTKIGWAGNDFPESYFRSNVAVLRDESVDESNQRRSPISQVNYDYYTRPIQSDGTDGTWQVANPIDPVTGLLYEPKSFNDGGGPATEINSNSSTDWYDLLQTFIRHGYSSAIQASPADHPLLMIERSYNPPAIRQQMLECIFEEIGAPATFLGKDAAMSCYGCGRVTATVVDIGYSGTTVSPVHEGYVEQKGIQRNPGAGVKAMDELLLERMDVLYSKQTQRVGGLKQHEPSVMPLYQVRRPNHEPRRADIHHSARLFLAQDCRETGVGAAINAQQAAGFAAPHKSYCLPDGTMLDIPSATRFAVADLLFGGDAESVKRREGIVATTKQRLSSYIDAIATSSMDTGDDKNEHDDKFSEAAAVGISKRKTKRTIAAAASTPANATKKGFSNRLLQRACSMHLQNHLEHLTASPIASMICDAAYRCDRDQQVALLGTVIVGGGGACLGPTEQAVPDLIREQVEGIIHQHTPGWRVKVLTPGLQERSVLSWLGGSILGSLGSFHEMWITKAEYEEWGTAIVNRKCP